MVAVFGAQCPINDPWQVFLDFLVFSCHFFLTVEALNGTITAEIYKVIAQAGKESASKVQRFNVCFDLKHNKKPTLPETNSSHLKMDGWNISFRLGWPIFRGFCR